MVREFKIRGNYLNGKDAEDYGFTGKLIFLRSPNSVHVLGDMVYNFVGFINDGRCPAEILNGRFGGVPFKRGNFMQFLKRYRLDDTILKHPSFKGREFSKPSLADFVCEDWPGILYYGRIIGNEEKQVSVEGFYNSALAKGIGCYDSHDKEVQRAVFNDCYNDPKQQEHIKKIIERIKTERKDWALGPWTMEILCPDGVPDFLKVEEQ